MLIKCRPHPYISWQKVHGSGPERSVFPRHLDAFRRNMDGSWYGSYGFRPMLHDYSRSLCEPGPKWYADQNDPSDPWPTLQTIGPTLSSPWPNRHVLRYVLCRCRAKRNRFGGECPGPLVMGYAVHGAWSWCTPLRWAGTPWLLRPVPPCPSPALHDPCRVSFQTQRSLPLHQHQAIPISIRPFRRIGQ